MSYPLDDVARTLASSTTPRREWLKLLGGLVAGGILGAVGIGRAVAHDKCGGIICFSDNECPINYFCRSCLRDRAIRHCKALA
jgi:hypothetical protein